MHRLIAGVDVSMTYRILRQTTREPMDGLELHVFARAYHAAWRHVHGSEPLREHVIADLDLLIDFNSAESVVKR